MYTQQQLQVLDKSRSLPSCFDSKTFEEMYWEVEEDFSFMLYEVVDQGVCYRGYYPGCGEPQEGCMRLRLIQFVEGFMVIRVIQLSSHQEIPEAMIHGPEEDDNWEEFPPEDDCYSESHEVAQLWFAPDGSQFFLQAARYNDSEWTEYNDGFILNDGGLMPEEEMDVRLFFSGIEPVESVSPTNYLVDSFHMCPAFIAMSEWLHRNSIEKMIDGLEKNAQSPIAISLKHWEYNTLWEMYLGAATHSAPSRYYHTIKIAHRNGFVNLDDHMQTRWMSLLDNISFCNGNLEDPRNYMPSDFAEKEVYWQKRADNKKRLMALEKEKRRKELEELRRLSDEERREREDKDYQERRGIMKALVIGNDKMYARVLQDVTEFYEEGVAQGFCLYNCRYFVFPDMLCFTVREVGTDKRLSTVTYDMKHEIIEANLTKGDQVPEMYDEIEELILSHKDVIRSLWQQCPDFIRPYEGGLVAQRTAHKWNLDNRDKEQRQKNAILARRALRAAKAEQKQIALAI